MNSMRLGAPSASPPGSVQTPGTWPGEERRRSCGSTRRAPPKWQDRRRRKPSGRGIRVIHPPAVSSRSQGWRVHPVTTEPAGRRVNQQARRAAASGLARPPRSGLGAPVATADRPGRPNRSAKDSPPAAEIRAGAPPPDPGAERTPSALGHAQRLSTRQPFGADLGSGADLGDPGACQHDPDAGAAPRQAPVRRPARLMAAAQTVTSCPNQACLAPACANEKGTPP